MKLLKGPPKPANPWKMEPGGSRGLCPRNCEDPASTLLSPVAIIAAAATSCPSVLAILWGRLSDEESASFRRRFPVSRSLEALVPLSAEVAGDVSPEEVTGVAGHSCHGLKMAGGEGEGDRDGECAWLVMVPPLTPSSCFTLHTQLQVVRLTGVALSFTIQVTAAAHRSPPHT